MGSICCPPRRYAACQKRRHQQNHDRKAQRQGIVGFHVEQERFHEPGRSHGNRHTDRQADGQSSSDRLKILLRLTAVL